MEFRNLQNSSLNEVVDALLAAFVNYFVEFPTDVNYWEKRFRLSRVRWDLSFGVFVEGRMIAFIINGVDFREGQKIAFNTGTGVLPDFRGKALVDRLYQFAYPHFQADGISHCQLEVIQENARAIAVYQRIGFSIDRGVCLWRGPIEAESGACKIEKVAFAEVERENQALEKYYSWDNINSVIRLLGEEVQVHKVWDAAGNELGYFALKPRDERCFLVQFEAKDERWEELLAAIAQQCPAGIIANVDDRRPQVLEALKKVGCESVIDQYEMSMKLEDLLQ